MTQPNLGDCDKSVKSGNTDNTSYLSRHSAFSHNIYMPRSAKKASIVDLLKPPQSKLEQIQESAGFESRMETQNEATEEVPEKLAIGLSATNKNGRCEKTIHSTVSTTPCFPQPPTPPPGTKPPSSTTPTTHPAPKTRHTIGHIQTAATRPARTPSQDHLFGKPVSSRKITSIQADAATARVRGSRASG